MLDTDPGPTGPPDFPSKRITRDALAPPGRFHAFQQRLRSHPIDLPRANLRTAARPTQGRFARARNAERRSTKRPSASRAGPRPRRPAPAGDLPAGGAPAPLLAARSCRRSYTLMLAGGTGLANHRVLSTSVASPRSLPAHAGGAELPTGNTPNTAPFAIWRRSGCQPSMGLVTPASRAR